MSFPLTYISIVLVISFISIILAYINAHLKYFPICLIVKKNYLNLRDVYRKKQYINLNSLHLIFNLKLVLYLRKNFSLFSLLPRALYVL